MNALGFQAATMTTKGNEPAGGRGGCIFVIFSLDNPTSSEIFFYPQPGASCTPWFLHPRF